jgi:ubiquinone/menaquinone biosynthesis C-methylase UbiE
VDRALISAVAHRWHPVGAPVSDAALSKLVDRLELGAGGRVLDLGCGFGEWLLAAVDRAPGAEGVGVDSSAPALREARARAERRGLSGRVRFVEADASSWTEGPEFDAVLCVGATHAFDGLDGTLAAARRHLRPGGRLLVGDGFWEGPPDDAVLAALGAEPDELEELPGVVAAVQRAGFEPGYGHVSSAEEWDEYEWCWTGALTQWALTEASAEDRPEALEQARAHRRDWLGGYRGRLGFVTMVLLDAGQ